MNKVPVREWHKIIRRKPSGIEKEYFPEKAWLYVNLPELNEEVLVTDGESVWIDRFEEWNGLFLNIGNIDEVTAWMELPEPYRESEE